MVRVAFAASISAFALAFVHAPVHAGEEQFRFSEPPMAVEPAGDIADVVIAPIFDEPFMCSEHMAGEGSVVGDALGTDCQIMGGVLDKGRSYGRLYRDDGSRNEDWYSWGANVLAPIDGVVVGLLPNMHTNKPGERGRPPAGLIEIRRADGVTVTLAHVADFAVKLDQTVVAGQVVAKVGNNGPSYAPHIHAGAFTGAEPLQIRWDQRAMAALFERTRAARQAD